MSICCISARVGALMMALAAGACGSTGQGPIKLGPVDTGAGSLTAARQFLEGRWSLLSYEVFPPGESPVRVTGSGTLTFDEHGNLATEIRVEEPAAKVLESVGIPVTNGRFSTSGRTVVDLQARTLTYILEGQPAIALGPPSGPLGLNRPRHWQVEGDVLTLTTRRDDGQPMSVGRWQKSP